MKRAKHIGYVKYFIIILSYWRDWNYWNYWNYWNLRDGVLQFIQNIAKYFII